MVKNVTLIFSVIIINIKVNVNIVPISIKGISLQTWDLSKNLHNLIFGPKIYTLKVRYLQLFLLKIKQKKCIDLVEFLLELIWVCKFLTVSVQNHT